jgi:hypothetical protein
MFRTSLCAGMAFVGASLGFAAPALAEEDLPSAAPIVSDEELEEQRGGFRFQGMDIRLGADIRTYLNGELALQTMITIDDDGFRQTQTISGALTQADADTLRNNVLSNGAITMNIGDQRVFLANEGQTALYHSTDGALQNVLINTASGVSASQEVTATLDVGGYTMFAEAIAADQLSTTISDDITRSVTGSLGL